MAKRRTQNGSNHSGSKRTFKAAVLATPMIASAFWPGVQALKREHRQGLRNAQIATGSIDLDATLEPHFHDDHRWDCGIGLPHDSRTEKVLWLVVHHAASGETDRVIKKLRALKGWLQNSAPELDRLPKKFVWQLSNVERNPNDRRSRNRLAEAGGIHLRVQGMLDLATI